MATLPRNYNSTTTAKQGPDAAGPGKYKKSKRLSWTLGRKKSRDDQAIVADGSGEVLTVPSVGW